MRALRCADGVLTKVGNDFLAVLVHGMFNATVTKPSEASTNSLEAGQTLKFRVRSLDVADSLLCIQGDMRSEKNTHTKQKRKLGQS